jgi:DNA-directed RNA polymerase specialized sigma24 family protein
VRCHIHHYEETGELPPGSVDPRDIVDEVARQAEEKGKDRPPNLSWLVWLFHLMHQEIQRQRDLFEQKEAGEIPTEKPVKVPELSEKKLHPLERIVQKAMEPRVIRVEDVVPGLDLPPDDFVAQKERIEQMLPELPRWPWIEREVFELYYIEGFEPDEIAKAMDQPVDRIQKVVDLLRERVRKQLLDPEEVPA